MRRGDWSGCCGTTPRPASCGMPMPDTTARLNAPRRMASSCRACDGLRGCDVVQAELRDLSKENLLANARMYSVAPAVAAAWRELLEWVLAQAGLPWGVVDHPAPKPLVELWERLCLGCALMCGLVHTVSFRGAIPIAAPVVAQPRYGGLPIYFTDILVRTTSRFET